MGRSKQRAIQRQKEKLQRRNRAIAIIVGVVAVLAVIGVILANRPMNVEVDDALLTRYEDIPVTPSDRGFPILGNPEAPVRLVEYSSFDCTHCRDFHEDVTSNILDRITSGEASFTYVPVYGTGSIPNGERAARAAVCAGEQGRFFEYHDLLFGWQGTYVASAFQSGRLEGGAEALGLDVAEWNSCLNSAQTSETLDNARAAFGQSGGTGTPTITVNDEVVSPSFQAVSAQIDLIMQTASPVSLAVEDETSPDESVVATEEVEVTEEATVESEVEVTEETTVEPEVEVTEETTVEPEVDATEEVSS